MRINRSTIKRDAKSVLAANGKLYIASLILLVVMIAVEFIAYKVTGVGKAFTQYRDFLQFGVYAEDFAQPTALSQLLNIVLNIFMALFSVGFTILCLRLCRRVSAGLITLLDGFGMFLRVIGLYIMIYIFVILWSLLLIVPGIIAAYRYRLAMYLLIENPDYGIMKCIRESKRLMKGRKGELFVLDLSFIGWGLLSCILPVMIYTLPYFDCTYANYYIAVKDLDEKAESTDTAQ